VKPYYEHAGITIYHADCRDVLPLLPPVDLVLTDPPYGIGWSRGAGTGGAKSHDGIQGDEDTSARDAVLAWFSNTPGIVFGSFYAPYPASLKQVLIWKKPSDSGVVGSVTGFRRDAEPIFLVGPWPQRHVRWSSVLVSTGGMGAIAATTGHPHTKPIPLLSSLLRYSEAKSVCDPFMGSGSTLRAAKDLGLSAIGVEIEESYCEIAAKRLGQEVFNFGAERCNREIAAMQRDDAPAWLVTLGVSDWEAEKRMIEGEA
jgi:site-specific DNA-methyltransferase (adenine-specific)